MSAKSFFFSTKAILIVLVLFSILSLWPFFKSGFFTTHDGEWMVIRFSAFHQTLRAGHFPVRFVDRLNNNYGYPVLDFLYPLPFYLAEVPKTIGFDYVNSIKIIFIFSTIASTVFMFMALREKYSKEASVVGAIIYLFVPYRFVDLYVRGSIGENLAFSFLPLVLLSILKIHKKKKIYFPILSLSTAALILSHNVIAVIFLPIFFIMSLVYLKGMDLYKTIAFFSIGVLISFFFAIPALFDLRYVRLSKIVIANPAEHLVSLKDALFSKWGYGPNPNDPNGFSAQVGIIPIFLLIASIIFWIKSSKKGTLEIFSVILFLLTVFLITKTSYFFWKITPYVYMIQFPWRILSVIVFVSAILAAYTVDNLNKKLLVLLTIVFFSIVTTISYSKPEQFVNRVEGFYTTNEDTTTVRNEYMPLWVNKSPLERAHNKFEINDKLQLLSSKIKPANYSARLVAQSDTTLTVNTIYFPGFVAKIDEKNIPIHYENQFGLIQVPLPKGTHEVIIKYNETSIHLITDLISASALLFTIILLIHLCLKKDS